MSQAVDINGYCDPRFESVKQAFGDNFVNDGEIGASFAATVDGKFVIDVYAGYADVARAKPWNENTIVNVWSSTKVMTAICGLMLVDRGLLDLDAPVARYWPEFAQNGKESLPVRCLFSHSAGLAGFGEPVTPETLYDWETCIHILERQKPLWEPGTASGYHGLTMGYLLGELVRRITGKTLGTFFREEVAEPFNADFYIGLPEAYDNRVAEMLPVVPPQPGTDDYKPLDPDTVRGQVRINQPIDQKEVNTKAWRRAEIPAANGHGNAHSMARIAAALACGGELNGVRLMAAAMVEKILEEQTKGIDLVLDQPVRWGLGMELTMPERMLGPNPRTFSWGGAGGSIIVVDLDARTSLAYAMNKMEDGPQFLDARNIRLREAFYKAMAGL